MKNLAILENDDRKSVDLQAAGDSISKASAKEVVIDQSNVPPSPCADINEIMCKDDNQHTTESTINDIFTVRCPIY